MILEITTNGVLGMSILFGAYYGINKLVQHYK